MKLRVASVAFFLLLCALYGSGMALAGERISAFVSIPPQKYVVQKIGGTLVSVSVMVPPGANPHLYEPRPTQMADLSKSQVYFAIGITFETVWLPKFAKLNPKMRIVPTDKGIDKLTMVSHHHEDEKDGGDPAKAGPAHKEEASGTPDPHVWVAPPEVKIIARNIQEALTEMDPSNSRTYQANLEAFLKEIDKLDQDLAEIFSDKKGLKFMVYHPAWGYFARAYGLEQVPVEMEGKEPKPEQLKALITQAKRDGIRIIFVQPQFSTKSAETIAKAINGQVIVADNLREDWEKNLRVQAQKFKQALATKNQ
ncbi:MAG: zinc ABC transporter substrate-binding protein [Desulfobacterota bacterium]|jgi:zinc transport system substrate-binding protein|nr:zinc ABC transporter substrate-binding protein [Thermodesulfobacteriota bacterium]